MAILKHMIGEKAIDGFNGVIDFYYYMGIACARRWPSSPGHNRSGPVMAQWPTFSYAAREWRNISQTVRDAYEVLATNSGLDAKDMFTRAYLTGLYRYPTP